MGWGHTAGSLLMFMVWDDYPDKVVTLLFSNFSTMSNRRKASFPPEEKRSRNTCPPVEVWILTILSFLP